MKTLKAIGQFVMALVIGFVFMSGLVMCPDILRAQELYELKKVEKGDEADSKTYCPKTSLTIGEGVTYFNCKDCHTLPDWGVKETPPFSQYDPPGYIEIKQVGDQLQAYTELNAIGTADGIENAFDWLAWHPEIKHWVIELQSPGGSMMSMKRIKGFMDMYKAMGGTIETRCMGYAASAAFNILINGTLGHRYVFPQAHIMWHEVSTVKWGVFVEDVSDLEDQSEIMRGFQNVENEWIASRSKVTKEELDNMIKRQELWVSGIEAVNKYGFADGFIGEQK